MAYLITDFEIQSLPHIIIIKKIFRIKKGFINSIILFYGIFVKTADTFKVASREIYFFSLLSTLYSLLF